MFNKIILVAITTSTAYAAVYLDGPCPDVKPVDYLDITMFAGNTWYEVARYLNNAEIKGNCTTLSYQNSTGNITFTLTNIINGKFTKMEGTLQYAPNAGTTGAVVYKSHNFEATEGFKTLPVYYVAVDYERYSIGFECIYNGNTNKSHVYAWINSRTKKLDGEAKKAVDEFIRSAPYMDASLFYWDYFDDAVCNVKA